MIELVRLEAVLDDEALAAMIAEIEAALPVGVRHRQLSVRSFLLGVACCLSDGRPAHLSRVHQALCAFEDGDRRRLGVLVEEKGVAHLLTYRQVEYMNHLLDKVLGKKTPDGLATTRLQELLDALIDASVPEHYKATSSLALDWTDYESFAHAPGKDGLSADPEAAWGHRRGGGPGEHSELFFGHYANLSTMVREADGPEVPELVRQMTMSACNHDPVPVVVKVLVGRFKKHALLPGDLLADSGYAHRVPEHFALPLRAAGASLVMDLHPSDRGPQGTFHGALAVNGNLYCPQTPTALLDVAPLPRGASNEEIAAHDEKTAELARYKLGRINTDDDDGYHRVACPAVQGKLRCPLRSASMALDYSRPEVLEPPEHPPYCCSQQSLTVPPAVNAKTRQKHDYPGKAWRASYARRSAVECSNSRIKDPATVDVAKGWCRVMGLVTPSLFLAVAISCRNLDLVDAFESRMRESDRRRAAGLEPRTRRRRRQSIAELAKAGPTAPP